MRKKIVIGIGAVVASAAIAGGATAYGSSDSDESVKAPQAGRAAEAALDATGGGTANSVEADNEDGATWEVEVTKPEGTTVDVRLDEDYQVVVIEEDSEHNDGDDAGE